VTSPLGNLNVRDPSNLAIWPSSVTWEDFFNSLTSTHPPVCPSVRPLAYFSIFPWLFHPSFLKSFVSLHFCMFHFCIHIPLLLYILLYPKLSSLFVFYLLIPSDYETRSIKTSQTARSWLSVKFTSRIFLWTPWRRIEERKYRSTRSYFRYYMQVCDELCAAAALPLGKQPPPRYLLGVSGPVRMFLEKIIFFVPAGRRAVICLSSNL
jgi:hypothetical protein